MPKNKQGGESLALIRNLVVKIGADISSLSKGLANAQSKIQNMSNSLTGIGQSLTMSVTVPLALLASQALSTSSQFEQSMANAASVASATTEELELMTEVALAMGQTTVFSASEAADALYYMASAGYDAEQMAQSIEPILNLASATQSDLAYTTDTVISSLNQFGLEATDAERVTNVFAAVIGNSQATLEKLTNSMRYVGPVANSLGYSIEETSAALGLLYNSGFKGEQAGTVLRSALSKLLAPTSSMTAALDELGVSYDEVNPSTQSLVDIVRVLEEAGITTAQAVALFGTEAGPGMMALIGQGADALEEMTEEITDTSAASEMAAVQLDTLDGSAKLMKSMLEDVYISIGNVLIPIMRELLEKYLMPLTEKFQNMSDVSQELAVKIGLLAAAVGPLFLVLGKVVGIVAKVVKVAGLVATPVGLIIAIVIALVAVFAYLFKTNDAFAAKMIAVWDKIKQGVNQAVTHMTEWWLNNGQQVMQSVADVFAKILSIVTTVVSGIIAMGKKMVSSIVYLWDNNQAFGVAIKAIWESIKQAVSNAISYIVDWWQVNGQKLWESISSIFALIWDVVVWLADSIIKSITIFLESLIPIWEQVKSVFASLWELLQELWVLLEPLIIAIGAVAVVAFAALQASLNAVIQTLGPLIEALLILVQVVIDVVGAIVAVLRGDFDGALEYIKDAGQGVLDFFTALWEAMKTFGLAFADSFLGFFEIFGVDFVAVVTDVCSAVGNWFTNLWSSIVEGARNVWTSITNVFSGIGDFFTGLFEDAYSWGRNLIQCIVDGINSAIDWVTDSVSSVGQKIKDFLGFSSPTKEGPGSTADKWMPNMIGMFADGIKANLPNLESAVGITAGTLSNVGNMQAPISVDNGDMINSMLSAMSVMQSSQRSNTPVELTIDGQVFARLIMPNISREYRRSGIKIEET